jgi:hypothetical protein
LVFCLEKDKKSSFSSGLPPELGEFIPGTSGLAHVDHSPFYEASNYPSSQKQSAANKIIHNWKLYDKTKDFIRRWKTLPENHPDFDQLGVRTTSPQFGTCASGSGGFGDNNKSSPVGSTSNICTVSSGGICTSGPSSSIVANSSSNLATAAGDTMVNPTQNQGGSGSGSGGNPGGGPSSSGSLSKFSKKNKGGGDHSGGGGDISSGFQSLSLGGKSGSVSFGGGGTTNGPFQDDGGQNGGTNKSSTGWSVHVWGE